MRSTGVPVAPLDQDDLANLSATLNRLLADKESALSKAIAKDGKVICLTPFLGHNAQSKTVAT